MIAGLLLAAGESTRMGSPKPLLDWDGIPLVRYQVRELRKAGCDHVVVVLGHAAGRIRAFVEGLDGASVAVNPDYRMGRATSVRAGALAVPPAAHWVLVLGVDQPRRSSLIKPVVDATRFSDAPIMVPTHGGRHGHPTAFAGRLLPELQAVEDETLGLRAVVRRHEKQVQEVEVPSDLIFLDLNTADEYIAAHRAAVWKRKA